MTNNNNKYEWQITLSNGEVYKESEHEFELSWEEPNCVSKIEMLNQEGEVVASTDLSTESDPQGPKQLFYRKRRVVRSNAEPETTYVYGFVHDGTKHINELK